MSCNVLYIEDDDLILSVVETIIKDVITKAVNLDIVKSIKDAKTRLNTKTYNLIISDCNVEDGYACDLFPIIDKNIPIIITTGDSNINNSNLIEYTKNNMPSNIKFLYKPFTVKDFVDTFTKISEDFC